MKIPRDVSGSFLIKKLEKFGYQVNRQVGSHIRLKSKMNGEHHLTIPNHNPLKTGTLSSILKDVSAHHGVTKEQLIIQLFG